MKKFIEWLGTWIPSVWTIAMVIILTFGSVGIAISIVEWVLKLLGVL